MPEDRYTKMAYKMLGVPANQTESSSVSTDPGMGQPQNLRQLAMFAKTPEGKNALQGAVDVILANRGGKGRNDINPYQYILTALEGSIRQRPPTA